MAYNNELQSITLALEVQTGVDKKGNDVYRKRNYNGIKGAATAEQLGIVAAALKKVIANPTRDIYKNSVEKVVNK